MCGIFFLLRFANTSYKIHPQSDIFKFYRMNNSGIYVDENSIPKFSPGAQEGQLSFEDLDIEFLHQGLLERGPDHIKGYYFILKVKKSGDQFENSLFKAEEQILTQEADFKHFFNKFAKEEINTENGHVGLIMISSILKMRRSDEEVPLMPQPIAKLTFPIKNRVNEEIFQKTEKIKRQENLESKVAKDDNNVVNIIQEALKKPTLTLTDEDFNLVFSYNGEIYEVNHERLKQLKLGPEYMEIISLVSSYTPATHDTEYLFKIIQSFIDHHFKKGSNKDLDILIDRELMAILNCLIGDFSLIFFYFTKTSFGVKVVKDQFGKRSVVMTNGVGFVSLSSLCPLRTSKIVSEKEVGGLGDFTPEMIDVDFLLPMTDGKLDCNEQRAQKMRNAIRTKYFDNFFKVIEKWGIEVPGNTVTSLTINSVQSTSLAQSGFVVLLNHRVFDEWYSKICFNSQFLNNQRPNESEAQGEVEGDEVQTAQDKVISDQERENFKDKVKILLEHSVENMLNNILDLGQIQQEVKKGDQAEQKSLEIDQNQEDFDSSAIHQNQNVIKSIKKTSSKVAILFSGGLDSSLIAHLAAIKTPPNEKIDLLNISFNGANSFDRKVAIQSYKELSLLHQNLTTKNHKFNLILINKDYEEVLKEEEHVYRRVYPQSTHLDFNIGAVLHYASRGEGYLYTTNSEEGAQDKDEIQADEDYETLPKVKSRARCLLDGLGADELFCGYRRYRTSFLRGGVVAMAKEMQFGIKKSKQLILTKSSKNVKPGTIF